MSGHTSGPWSVRPATDGFEFDIMADGFFVAAIPDVPGHTEANAHLIAATPELLDMLRRVFAWDHYVPFGGELRALIAKAEGREP